MDEIFGLGFPRSWDEYFKMGYKERIQEAYDDASKMLTFATIVDEKIERVLKCIKIYYPDDSECLKHLCNYGQWYVTYDGGIACDKLENNGAIYFFSPSQLTSSYDDFKRACGEWMVHLCEKGFVLKSLITDFIRAFTLAWGRTEETNHMDEEYQKCLQLCCKGPQVFNKMEYWKVLYALQLKRYAKLEEENCTLKRELESPFHKYVTYENVIKHIARHPSQEEVLRSMLEALLPKSEHDKLVDDIEEKRNQRKRSTEKTTTKTIINNYNAGSTAQVINGDVHDSKIG